MPKDKNPRHPCIKFHKSAVQFSTQGHFLEIQISSKPAYPTNKKPQSHPVMKKYLSYSLILATAATGLAHGAATAYTTPVGYVSVAIPASGDSTIGQPLHRSPLFTGASIGINGDVISVAPGSFTVNQLAYAKPVQTNTYYALVTSGPLAGRYYEISSNGTDSVTIVPESSTLQAQGFTAATTFSVIPYWTLNTLFPAGSGVGVTTADIFSPVSLVQFRSLAIGKDRAASSTYFYYNGTEEAGTGWYNNDDLGAGIQNDLVIDPSLMATVRNLQPIPKTATISGTVPSVVVKTPLITGGSTNDNYLNPQLPIDLTLAGSGISSVITPATDIFSPVDTVFVYNDSVSSFDKAAFRTFFYYVGTEEAGTGWYDNDDLGAGLQNNSPVLKAGRAFVIRKAAGTPTITQFSTPLPYSL
jgi:uncharacterized protein (TIGR02597 family)